MSEVGNVHSLCSRCNQGIYAQSNHLAIDHWEVCFYSDWWFACSAETQARRRLRVIVGRPSWQWVGVEPWPKKVHLCSSHEGRVLWRYIYTHDQVI